MAKEDSLELIVDDFWISERGGEGEEVVVSFEISLFERVFKEVWTRLGLVEGLIVGVFLVCVILVYGILAGAYEILFYGFEIGVTSEETERSDDSSVIFCEIRIFESYEAVFFIVGFIEADFGEIVVIFEEEKREDGCDDYDNNMENQ